MKRSLSFLWIHSGDSKPYPFYKEIANDGNDEQNQ